MHLPLVSPPTRCAQGFLIQAINQLLYLCRLCSQASRLIVTFDEHVISNNFKFGVVYQKFSQVSGTFFPDFFHLSPSSCRCSCG